jgi:hypothetical protein
VSVEGVCPSQGSLGAVLQVGVCPVFSCTSCQLGQTCDVAFGLCKGALLFNSPNLTLAATTTTPSAAVETWVIAVAVVVPAVVLLGVAGAVLLVYLRRREAARYDGKTNAELRDNQMQAMRTNNPDY